MLSARPRSSPKADRDSAEAVETKDCGGKGITAVSSSPCAMDGKTAAGTDDELDELESYIRGLEQTRKLLLREAIALERTTFIRPSRNRASNGRGPHCQVDERPWCRPRRPRPVTLREALRDHSGSDGNRIRRCRVGAQAGRLGRSAVRGRVCGADASMAGRNRRRMAIGRETRGGGGSRGKAAGGTVGYLLLSHHFARPILGTRWDSIRSAKYGAHCLRPTSSPSATFQRRRNEQ